MSAQLVVAGMFIESMHSEIHQRRNGVHASVSVGVRDIQVDPRPHDELGSPATVDVVKVTFTHHIDANDEEGTPFYSAAIKATAFLTSVDESPFATEPKDALLRMALALTMPITSMKLREALTMMSLDPAPRIPSYVNVEIEGK